MLTRLAAALLLSLAIAVPARSEVPVDVVQVELLPGWREADGRHMAGLRLRLAPGWKTYWRAPGEAGLPPQFDFTAARNLADIAVHWPAPTVFSVGGHQTVGYEESVVLPLEVQPLDTEAPVRLSGEVALGICREVCVPVRVEVDAVLEAGSAADPRIVEALTRTPRTAEAGGVRTASCRVEPGRSGLALVVAIEMPSLGNGETALIEAGGTTRGLPPAETRREGDMLIARVALAPEQSVAIDRSTLRITVLAEERAVQIDGCDD